MTLNAVRSNDADRFWEVLTCQRAQHLTASKKCSKRTSIFSKKTVSPIYRADSFFLERLKSLREMFGRKDCVSFF